MNRLPRTAIASTALESSFPQGHHQPFFQKRNQSCIALPAAGAADGAAAGAAVGVALAAPPPTPRSCVQVEHLQFMRLQVLLTGRLLRRLHPGAALAALPLTAGALMAAIAAWPSTGMVAGAEVLRKVTFRMTTTD